MEPKYCSTDLVSSCNKPKLGFYNDNVLSALFCLCSILLGGASIRIGKSTLVVTNANSLACDTSDMSRI